MQYVMSDIQEIRRIFSPSFLLLPLDQLQTNRMIANEVSRYQKIQSPLLNHVPFQEERVLGLEKLTTEIKWLLEKDVSGFLLKDT